MKVNHGNVFTLILVAPFTDFSNELDISKGGLSNRLATAGSRCYRRAQDVGQQTFAEVVNNSCGLAVLFLLLLIDNINGRFSR